MKKTILTALAIGLIAASCTKDEHLSSEESQLKAVSAKASSPAEQITQNIGSNIEWNLPNSAVRDFDFNVVEPSECGATPFNSVLSFYNNELINGFIASWDGNPDAIDIILGDYFIVNQIAALDENFNADTFGANGEFTNYVKKRVRSLEKFWNMSGLIDVRGQHTSTLEDLDFLRLVYENYSTASPEEIDYILGIAEHFNTTSDQIPENPFYALDGFATFSGFIVIGDGIVSTLAETGIDPKVVWSSILAHEWAHQMQFLNFGNWAYPVPPFINTPESTRMTELEADFLTGFYLTHKRGATYNWKRVEDFMEAFFNIGDCGFTSPGHHGTPLQRLEAARQGFLLATNIKKKGKIPSQTEVHDAFVDVYNDIVGESAAAGSENENPAME
ncbi:MAG: hypothetical protein ACR2MT_09860 [Aurantibacter sp.]